jgi:hypothetical protein
VVLALLATLVTLFGTVTRGPVTPVCVAGSPCNVPASEATLTFTRAGGSFRVRTDDAGRYRIRLAPGLYAVRADTGIRIAPAKVRVLAGRKTQRQAFAIDTGLR